MTLSVSKVVLLSVIMYSAGGTITLPTETNFQNQAYMTEQNIYYSNSNSQIPTMISISTGMEEFSMSIPLTRNLNKLNDIASLTLKDDKSITFSKEFTKEISNILFCLDYQPEIFPNFKGNIQFEYEEDNGKYLEIEITPDMKMNIFKIDANGNEFENDDYLDINMDTIKKEVNSFYE